MRLHRTAAVSGLKDTQRGLALMQCLLFARCMCFHPFRKDGSRVSRYRVPTSCWAYCGMSSGILYQRGAGRSSATAAVGQPVVENARHGGDQSIVIALAGATAGELDGSRQRSFDHEGIRPSADEHRERTTIRRREVGAGNGKRFWAGADCSSARPPRESERIGERGDKFTTRILSGGQIRKQTNRVAVSVPRPGIRPGLDSIQRLD